MGLRGVAASAAAVAMVCAMPVRAQGVDEAGKLRRLDIMLMVTGLRCRATADDFQADFHDFEARHLAELDEAAATVRADFAGRLGAHGAERELDRISTTMANAYGGGHPWLGCRDLKAVTRDLADSANPAELLAAADELLIGDGPRLAYRTE